MGSGSILREVIAAADLLENDYGVASDIWSVTSFNEVRKDGYEVSRRNRLNPDESPKTPWMTGLLKDRAGPAVAATDYVRAFADQVREFVPQDDYIVLGTDGFGRSDTRENLRRFFEVDRYNVAWAALVGLNRQGKFDDDKLAKARSALNIDPDKPLPTTV